jgi:hypothetical protein
MALLASNVSLGTTPILFWRALEQALTAVD